MIYIPVVGACQTLIAFHFFSLNMRRRKTDAYLIAFLICLCVQFVSSSLFLSMAEDSLVKQALASFLSFTYAPLVLLFVRRLNNPNVSLAKYWYLFIPALLFGAAYFWIMGLAMGSHPTKSLYVNLYNIVTVFTLPSFSTYLLYIAVNIASRFTEKLKEEKIMIKQVALVVFFMMISVFSFFVYAFVTDLPFEAAHVVVRSIFYTGMLFLCFIIIMYKWKDRQRLGNLNESDTRGVKWVSKDLVHQSLITADTAIGREVVFCHPHVFFTPSRFFPAKDTIASNAFDPATDLLTNTSSPLISSMPVEEHEIEAPPVLDKKVAKASLLSPEKQKAIYTEIEKIVRERKLFLDEDFNLDKLAAAASIQRQYISESLNQHAQQSFYQFINGYRIAAVIAKMETLKEQPIQINLTILAFDCGFRSKAPFNQYFKKHTGLTPSEYMHRLREQKKN